MVNALFVSSLTIGILLAGISHLFVWMVRETSNRGKKRVVWVDDDARELGVGLVRTGGKRGNVRLGENEFVVGKGAQAQLFRLDGRAAYGGKFPSYIVHKRHGFVLRGPTDAESVHRDPGLALALSIADPLASFKARTRNHAADTMNSNEEKQPFPFLGAVGIVCGTLVVIVLAVVFAMYKMGAAGGGA